jgi:galactose-1-phosphate uridylyltransferase
MVEARGSANDMLRKPDCPFCSLDPDRTVMGNELAVALYDRFPVSPGHCLIVTRRHVASFFEASEEERAALLQLLDKVRELLLRERRPAGFNIGINDGIAAGQPSAVDSSSYSSYHAELSPPHPKESLTCRQQTPATSSWTPKKNA